MVSFEQFKKGVNELYALGKLEFFKDRDKHSHECLSMYLYCSSIDSKRLKVIDRLKPEYWNIIPYDNDLQIYVNIIHVNKESSEVNKWLEENLYLKVQNLTEDQ